MVQLPWIPIPVFMQLTLLLGIIFWLAFLPTVARYRAYHNSLKPNQYEETASNPKSGNPNQPDPESSDDSDKSWWKSFKNWVYRNSYYIVGGISIAALLFYLFYDDTPPAPQGPPVTYDDLTPHLPPNTEYSHRTLLKAEARFWRAFQPIDHHFNQHPPRDAEFKYYLGQVRQAFAPFENSAGLHGNSFDNMVVGLQMLESTPYNNEILAAQWAFFLNDSENPSADETLKLWRSVVNRYIAETR